MAKLVLAMPSSESGPTWPCSVQIVATSLVPDDVGARILICVIYLLPSDSTLEYGVIAVSYTHLTLPTIYSV